MYGTDLLTRNICENESILRKYRVPVIDLLIDSELINNENRTMAGAVTATPAVR